MIGLVAVTAAGRQAAAELSAAWPGLTRTYDGPAAEALAFYHRLTGVGELVS